MLNSVARLLIKLGLIRSRAWNSEQFAQHSKTNAEIRCCTGSAAQNYVGIDAEIHLTRCLRTLRARLLRSFSATLWPRATRAKGPGQGKCGDTAVARENSNNKYRILSANQMVRFPNQTV